MSRLSRFLTACLVISPPYMIAKWQLINNLTMYPRGGAHFLPGLRYVIVRGEFGQ